MPIQTAEYVAVAEAAAEGTAHEALTLVTTGCGFCMLEATTYPAQFRVLVTSAGSWLGGGEGVGEGVGVGKGD